MSKKTVALIGIILLIILIMLFTFWPSAPTPVVNLPPITVTPGNETAWQQLQLGHLYEENHSLDNAQTQYEKAAISEQGEIAIAAREGIERTISIQISQTAPISSLRQAIKDFLTWIVKNLLLLVVAGLFIWLIWFLLRRRPRRSGYLALPFEDYTTDGLGKGFHTQLYATLNEAKQTYQHGRSGLINSSDQLDLPIFGILSATEDTFANALTVLDSFSVSHIDLPLGKILLAFRRWFGNQEYTIFGTLFEHGDSIQVQVELRRETDNSVQKTWMLPADKTLTKPEQTAALVDSLAFRILYDESPDLEVNSWRSLQLYANALTQYQRYGDETIDLSVVKDSVHLLTEALVLDPGFPLAHFWLGVAHGLLGNYRAARGEFKDVLAIDSRLKIETNYNLGLAFYQEFEPWTGDKAEAHFKSVITDLNANNLSDQEKLLLSLTYCGLAAVQAQRLHPKMEQDIKDEITEEVESYCQQALDLADNQLDVTASVYYARGLAYLQAGQNDKAISKLEEAIQMRPGYAVAYVALAKAYESKKPDESIQWLQTVLRWRPNYEYAHFRLGRIYRTQGETEAAKEAYRQAEGISEARNSLGEILAKDGEYKEALLEFQHATRINRRNARAWGNLAWWTVVSGKKDEESLKQATAWARRATQLNAGKPFEWLNRDVLGWILFLREQHDQAESELKQSIQLDKNKHIQNRYHLAYLYKYKGPEFKQEAIRLLSEALSLPEGGHWREESVKLIKELT